MKNPWLWFLLLLLFLIFIGVLTCPAPPVHNHFVGSGDINFLGDTFHSIDPDQPDGSFITARDCFDKDVFNGDGELHFHVDFNIESLCNKAQNALVIATVTPRLLINGMDQTSNIDFTARTAGGNSFSKISNSSIIPDIVLDNSDVTKSSGATPCKSSLDFDFNIPSVHLPKGVLLHLVLEIKQDQNFQTYGTNYDPTCSTQIATCDAIAIDLHKFQCYEDLNCERKDRFLVIGLFPICNAQTSPSGNDEK